MQASIQSTFLLPLPAPTLTPLPVLTARPSTTFRLPFVLLFWSFYPWGKVLYHLLVCVWLLFLNEMASTSICCPANDRISFSFQTTLHCVLTPSFYPFCCQWTPRLCQLSQDKCVCSSIYCTAPCTPPGVCPGAVSLVHTVILCLDFEEILHWFFSVVILICTPMTVNKRLFPYTHILTSTVIFLCSDNRSPNWGKFESQCISG